MRGERLRNKTVKEIRKWSTTKSGSAHIKPVQHKQKSSTQPHWPLGLPPSDLKLQKHATADPRNTVQSSELKVNASLIRPTMPANFPPGKSGESNLQTLVTVRPKDTALKESN